MKKDNQPIKENNSKRFLFLGITALLIFGYLTMQIFLREEESDPVDSKNITLEEKVKQDELLHKVNQLKETKGPDHEAITGKLIGFYEYIGMDLFEEAYALLDKDYIQRNSLDVITFEASYQDKYKFAPFPKVQHFRKFSRGDELFYVAYITLFPDADLADEEENQTDPYNETLVLRKAGDELFVVLDGYILTLPMKKNYEISPLMIRVEGIDIFADRQEVLMTVKNTSGAPIQFWENFSKITGVYGDRKTYSVRNVDTSDTVFPQSEKKIYLKFPVTSSKLKSIRFEDVKGSNTTLDLYE